MYGLTTRSYRAGVSCTMATSCFEYYGESFQHVLLTKLSLAHLTNVNFRRGMDDVDLHVRLFAFSQPSKEPRILRRRFSNRGASLWPSCAHNVCSLY